MHIEGVVAVGHIGGKRQQQIEGGGGNGSHDMQWVKNSMRDTREYVVKVKSSSARGAVLQ